jgi:uncharacterized protein involved in exopolysaccharide biosynthesis
MNHSPPDHVAATPLEQRAASFRALTLRDLLFWFSKWKWEFLAVFGTTVLAALAYIMLFRDPVFVSEARLFVRLSQEQTAPRTLVTQQGTTLLTPATSDVTSEIDLFLTTDLAFEVIDAARLLDAINTQPPPPETLSGRLKAAYRTASDKLRNAMDEAAYALGVKVRLSPREALLRQLQMSLGVQNSQGSNVVVVSMRWPDREVPKLLLQHYLDAFYKFRLDAFRSSDAEYFERQMLVSRERMRTIEGRIADLRAVSGIDDVTVQRGILIDAREQARRAFRTAELDLERVRARIAALGARGGASAPLVLADLPENPILRLLDERSIALREERLRIQSLPSLDGASLSALDQSFELLSASTIQSIRDYEARLATDLAAAGQEIETLDTRLAALATNEVEWNMLQAELTLAAENYEDNARRLSADRSSDDLRAERISNVVVIQRPTEPSLATGTRNAVVLTVGAVFALLLAASWVVLREALDSRVWRAEDLSGLSGLKLLGMTRAPGRRRGIDDLAFVAASLAPICRRRKLRTLAYMAVVNECSNPAQRTRSLAAKLEGMGLSDIEIVNAGRWSESGSVRPALEDMAEGIASPHAVAAGAPSLSNDDDSDNRLLLVAAAPLFSSIESMKCAQSADAVVFDIKAGSDDLADVEAANRWIRLHGGQTVGVILADIRHGAYRSVVTA